MYLAAVEGVFEGSSERDAEQARPVPEFAPECLKVRGGTVPRPLLQDARCGRDKSGDACLVLVMQDGRKAYVEFNGAWSVPHEDVAAEIRRRAGVQEGRP